MQNLMRSVLPTRPDGGNYNNRLYFHWVYTTILDLSNAIIYTYQITNGGYENDNRYQYPTFRSLLKGQLFSNFYFLFCKIIPHLSWQMN